MKTMHLHATAKKLTKTPAKAFGKKVYYAGRCNCNDDVLMPEKLALANKMLKGVILPKELFSK